MCGKTCWAGYVWYNTLGFKVGREGGREGGRERGKEMMSGRGVSGRGLRILGAGMSGYHNYYLFLKYYYFFKL